VIGRLLQKIDMLQLAFVAYVAIIAGVVLLIVYGREEATTGATLVAGGLGMAAVRRYMVIRSAGSGDDSDLTDSER
jgi:hypothetical protein